MYRVSFSGNEGSLRIPAIKAIREATGLGLKEAKDVSDQGWYDTPNEIVAASVWHKLQDLGIKVEYGQPEHNIIPLPPMSQPKAKRIGRSKRLAMYRAAWIHGASARMATDFEAVALNAERMARAMLAAEGK